MATYNHGVRVLEEATAITVPKQLEGGITVVVGTAPVNLLDDPTGAVNKLTVCKTFDEAKAAFGFSDDFANYGICEAMYTFFKCHYVGPIAIINVLDPSKHRADYEETLTVSDGVATATKLGVLKDGLSVKNGSTDLVKDTDYVLGFNDDGYLTISILASGVTSVNVAGGIIDPTAVTASDIIGSVDATTGAETGLELIRRVYPYTQLPIGYLICPNWSKVRAVSTAMNEKVKKVNGSFVGMALTDLDTEKATTYGEAEELKAANFLNEATEVALWPMVKVDGYIINYSSMYAALSCKLDFENDNVPNIYPSNKLLKIDAAVLADGTEVNLDDEEANDLNANGIVTIVNHNGLKSWGNNTCIYPDSTDPKDRWIACRRMFSWWGNNFIIAYQSKVDDNMNKRLIQDIVSAENIRGNAIVGAGKAASIRIEYLADDNPSESLVSGKITFRQHFAPYTPAEDIVNIMDFDVDALTEAINGGE